MVYITESQSVPTKTNENEDRRITIAKNGSGEVKYKQQTRESEVLLDKCY